MKNYFKYFPFIALVAVLILPAITQAQVQTTTTQAQINALMQQIQALQAQLTQLQAQQGATTAWCHNFNENLKVGTGGIEVQALISALVKEGFLDGEFSEKNDFNETVAAAVSGFQQKYASEILAPYSLKYGTGFVGKSTRAKLNKLYSCSSNNSSGEVSCTMEAKQCPDGSFVGRVLPSCAFKPCPTTSVTPGLTPPTIAIPTSAITVDLKINGLDGPLTLTDNQKITASWTSNGTSCYITNVRPTSDALNQTVENLPPSGYRDFYSALSGSNNGIIAMQCGYAIDEVRTSLAPVTSVPTNPSGYCTNNATNPPTCTSCPNTYLMVSGTCVPNICANSATNPPTCTTINGICINDKIDPPNCVTTRADWLIAIYQTYLGRTPDAAGLNFYLDRLTSGAGTQSQVKAEIAASQEAMQYTFLKNVFQTELGRAPDTGGLAFYMNLLLTGTRTQAQVTADIHASPEAAQYRATLNAGALAPSSQYSASMLENIKATLDQIQKTINDWSR